MPRHSAITNTSQAAVDRCVDPGPQLPSKKAVAQGEGYIRDRQTVKRRGSHTTQCDTIALPQAWKVVFMIFMGTTIPEGREGGGYPLEAAW